MFNVEQFHFSRRQVAIGRQNIVTTCARRACYEVDRRAVHQNVVDAALDSVFINTAAHSGIALWI